MPSSALARSIVVDALPPIEPHELPVMNQVGVDEARVVRMGIGWKTSSAIELLGFVGPGKSELQKWDCPFLILASVLQDPDHLVFVPDDRLAEGASRAKLAAILVEELETDILDSESAHTRHAVYGKLRGIAQIPLEHRFEKELLSGLDELISCHRFLEKVCT